MKKIRLAAVLIAGITAFSGVEVFGAQKITVKVDGKEVVFDQEPVNVNSRVMVPVRFVAEAMGWEVSYYENYNKEMKRNEPYVSMTKYVQENKEDSPVYKTNLFLYDEELISWCEYKNEYEIDNRPFVAKPVILNGRTLIGVRDIAEGLHAEVEWVGQTKTVEIKTKSITDFPNFHKLIAEKPEIYTPIDPTPGKAFDIPEKADEILALANKERKNVGSGDIYINEVLTQAANIRAKEIASEFSHTRPNGDMCWSAVDEIDPTYASGKSLGEIIQGMSYKPTAEHVIKNWMNSKGHRETLLKKEYFYVGIGHAEIDGSHYWVMMFSD